MSVFDAAAEAAFREQIRAFVDAHVDQELRRRTDHIRHLTRDQYYAWQQSLVGQGWGAVNWPVPWGGTDWSGASVSSAITTN